MGPARAPTRRGGEPIGRQQPRAPEFGSIIKKIYLMMILFSQWGVETMGNRESAAGAGAGIPDGFGCREKQGHKMHRSITFFIPHESAPMAAQGQQISCFPFPLSFFPILYRAWGHTTQIGSSACKELFCH